MTKIYTKGVNLNDTIEPLKRLTEMTNDTYKVHDFRFITWGYNIEVKGLSQITPKKCYKGQHETEQIKQDKAG
jgi:hypothetical protein